MFLNEPQGGTLFLEFRKVMFHRNAKYYNIIIKSESQIII
jgi:hypothetical protein